MISIGRRDGRKEVVGLGFGGGGGGGVKIMEDTELEEGEACSYDHNHNNDNHDYDFNVDPDISLSYLGEKVEYLLGHLQKDFEGGVSAENLGAKFGGYGSFLPAYERSPVWSHPRTPQKTHQSNISRSPNNSQLEGGRRSSVSSSTAPQSVRPEPASTSAVSLPVSKTSSSLFESVRPDACMPSAHAAEELVPRNESMNRKSAIKVRIKVGSDNLSTRKNAAIYSGLGLDISPSSSLDDSPSESEGVSHEPQDPFESPGYILRTMTSFPVLGCLLLSPLSDDLIHLKEREKVPKDGGSLPVSRVRMETSGTVMSRCDTAKDGGKVLEEKKIKSLERKEISTESKSENCRDAQTGIDVIAKKERELDTFACDELVSNTLKLPLLSSSHPADSTKGISRMSGMHKGAVKEKCLSGQLKDEMLVPTFSQEKGSMENSKSISAGKVWEDKKASSLDSDSVYPRKDGHFNGEKPYNLVKIDSNVAKGRKSLGHASKDLPKQKPDQKAISSEQEGMKVPLKEHSSSEGKNKIKGSQNHGNLLSEAPKESLKAGSSSVSKTKKNAYGTKGESDDLKLQQNSGKVGDRYREFFGEMELEQEEKRMSPLETNYEDRLKDSAIVEKSTHQSNITLKDRSTGKNIDKLPTFEALPKVGDGPKDDWVQCDKCQQWRMLPLGLDPKNLPEKWLCSMQYWLPGMNRCSLSEEETTNMVKLYNQNNPSGATSGVTLTDVRHSDQNHLNIGSPAVLTGGKKKHGLKELSTTTHKDGSAQLSNAMKKSMQASATNGSLNGMISSPMVSEPDSLKLNKSGDLSVERHKHKPKEKHKVLDNCTDGGGSKRSRMKVKRDPDQDCFKASKKMRNEYLPEDWISDHGGAIEKVGPSSSNGLPIVKNLPKHNDRTFSKDAKNDQMHRVSAKKPKEETRVSMDNGSLDMGTGDGRDVKKKRKMKESHDAQVFPGHVLDSGMLAKEEFSENEYKKDKKARTSRSDGKEASTSKGNGRVEKKGSHRKKQRLGQDLGTAVSQRSLDGVDPLKRDSGSLHPSVAATSSSSKVSGSRKTRSSFHDTKGSPVESVSSSPMRVSKAVKLTSGRKTLTGKDDPVDAGLCKVGGQRRVSEGDDEDGIDGFGTARKENTLNVAQHDSVLDFREREVPGGKAKPQIPPSPDIANHHISNCVTDFMGQDTAYGSKSISLDRGHDNERQNENRHVNGTRVKKSGKGSSSRAKDKNKNFYPGSDDKVKVSDLVSEPAQTYEKKPIDSKNKIEEKLGGKSDDIENGYSDKKNSVALLLSETGKQERQSNILGGRDSRVGPVCSDDATSTPKKSVLLGCDTLTERGKPLALPSSGAAQNESLANLPQPVSGSVKGTGAGVFPVIVSDGGDASKASKQSRKLDHANGIEHNAARNPMSNGHRIRDVDAPSPIKRDCSSQAANNALKEAKNLKHMADRLKSAGSTLESTKLYFEAVLKFLHGASLLETCSGENAKTGEMILSMQVYSSTAKLCGFCAHEYEKSKDMAAAALAYKCMEVAYMRVIYCSHTSANRDRHELQTALQVVPPGESPSSSASDIDNLNHPTTAEKVPLAKGISSPQVTGSHIIAARNRPNFVHLLNFAQDVHFAMEASRKSRSAFAVANVHSGEVQNGEAISSIKAALDFNFQDVEGFLRLVRLAIEALSH